MDGVHLHRLGKRLIELARDVTTQRGDAALTAGEVAVLEDVLAHPDSAITEIAVRTGFVQSHVSGSVARLAARGLVETAPDESDGRRTRVHLAGRAAREIVRRAGTPADEAVGRALADPADTARVVALLDELAGFLLGVAAQD